MVASLGRAVLQKKFVRLHPVGKKLQLERVGLATSSQVVVELRYEAAHEEVVVVVSEQGEALIGDRHRVTIGTRRGTIVAHEGGKVLSRLAARRAGHVG